MHRLTRKTKLSKKQRQPYSGDRFYSAGFTILEIIVVIVIIGILATLSFISYNGAQQQARDKSLLADLDQLDSIEALYSMQTKSEARVWNSANDAPDSSLNFTPSPGNVVDVSTNGIGYCIRAYNPMAATYKSFATAAKKGAEPTSCYTIFPPVDEYIAATRTWTVPTGVTSVTLQVWGGSGSNCYYDMGGTGGSGGHAKGTLAVVPGDVLNVTVGWNGADVYSYCGSNLQDGSDTYINRPAASVLLRGVGGAGAYDCDCDMDPSVGITYAGLTNVSVGSGRPPHALITYTPPPLP